MKFRQIFHYEFFYQLRRLSTWLYFVVLMALAFLFITGNYIHDARDGDFFLNAPLIIATVTVFCCLFWLLIGSSVAGDAATRDVQMRMYSLTYTAPTNKFEHLGGRFFAAFVLNLLILIAVPLGIIFSIHFTGVEADILGPFRPTAYTSSFLYFLLPNAFIVTAVQFSMSTLSNQAKSSLLGGIILFVAAYVLGQVLELAGGWGTLVDPIGFTPVLSHLTNDWSPIEKNTRLIELDGLLLINRFLWLSISLGLLTFTYYRFRFVQPGNQKSKKDSKHQSKLVVPVENIEWSVEKQSLPQIPREFGFLTNLKQLSTITWNLFLHLAKSPSGLMLLAVIATLVGFAIPGNLDVKGVPLIARADQILNFLTSPLAEIQTFWILITLLIIFYAGELVWKEREAGLSEITGVAPISNWVLFLSRFLPLVLLLISGLLFLMLAGIVAQLSMGSVDLEIGLYIKTLFGFQLIECLLFALLALVIHVIIDQKYMGHLVVLITYGFIAFSSTFGVDHKLLIYGSSPSWFYTDMGGFGNSLVPWLWFKGYWIAWALLLSIVASLLWVRGKEEDFKSRLKLAYKRFTGYITLAGIVATGLIVSIGGFIFYNTYILNEYTTTSDLLEQQSTYEQLFGKYDGIPQPKLAGVKLHVDIFPEQREVEIHAAYSLLNKTTEAIDSIHLVTPAGVEATEIVFDKSTVSILEDKKLGYQIYKLNKPLQPDDSLQLSFDVKYKTIGFTNSGIDDAVVANGTNFRNYEWMPAIGYQSYKELDDVSTRKKYGLSPRPATPSLYDVTARQNSAFAESISFEAIVGTDTDQVVLAPGSLRKTWMKNGRQYFHYSTDAPIRNEYYFFSANYAIHEGIWNDVKIQIYYDPGQIENVVRMVSSIQASLDYYSKYFAPYPYKNIRFVAYPGYGIGNHAAPLNITAEEGFFLLNPEEDPRGFDLVSAVVAHEVAHQWWGNLSKPARVEGSGLISESLAWYSTMSMIEEAYGPEHLQRLLSFLREEYETLGTQAAAPLLQANDWYHIYRKGPLALFTMGRYIGKEKVNGALASMYTKHSSGTPPFPTSLDLYKELQAATPDSLQSLLFDLFEQNTFWDLQTEQVSATETESGDWLVTLKVRTYKQAVDKIGVVTELPINDWIEIGVFGIAVKNKLAKPLYLQKHHITSTEQIITVTVSEQPTQAGIDPYYLLVDWEMNDNVKDVEAKL